MDFALSHLDDLTLQMFILLKSVDYCPHCYIYFKD